MLVSILDVDHLILQLKCQIMLIPRTKNYFITFLLLGKCIWLRKVTLSKALLPKPKKLTNFLALRIVIPSFARKLNANIHRSLSDHPFMPSVEMLATGNLNSSDLNCLSARNLGTTQSHQ